MPRASSVSLGKYRRVGSASWWNARIDDTPPPQHQRIQSITYAKSSYPHDRFNSGQKTDAFDTNIASPSRQHNSTVRVSHRCIVTAAEFGRCHQRRDEIHFVGFPSLGAPAEFGRSRQVWALSPSLGALRLRYISTLLAIPEWWLGVYSWFMASCTLVRHQDKKEFGMGCRDTQLTTDESWRACVDILLSWDDELAQCAFTFTKKVTVPAAILFCGMSMVAARIFASGAPANVAFPPSPIHLLTAFNNDWLSHKYRNGSSISVSQSASKHAANLGRFELKPSSSRLCTGAFSFFPPVIISCSHFCLNRHLPFFALKPVASEHAYLCAHLVIAFFPFLSHLTFDFSSWYSGRFLQSCFSFVCHMAILVNPTRRIPFAHCAFDVALSPPRFPAHWLPVSSFLIHLLSCCGCCLLAVVWDDFFSIGLKRVLLFVFFPRPAPNHPILRLAHLFRPLLLLLFW